MRAAAVNRARSAIIAPRRRHESTAARSPLSGLAAELAAAPAPDGRVVRPASSPLHPTGGVVLAQGQPRPGWRPPPDRRPQGARRRLKAGLMSSCGDLALEGKRSDQRGTPGSPTSRVDFCGRCPRKSRRGLPPGEEVRARSGHPRRGQASWAGRGAARRLWDGPPPIPSSRTIRACGAGWQRRSAAPRCAPPHGRTQLAWLHARRGGASVVAPHSQLHVSREGPSRARLEAARATVGLAAATFLVDQRGEVRASAIGPRDWDSAPAHAVIEAMVGSSSTPTRSPGAEPSSK